MKQQAREELISETKNLEEINLVSEMMNLEDINLIKMSIVDRDLIDCKFSDQKKRIRCIINKDLRWRICEIDYENKIGHDRIIRDNLSSYQLCAWILEVKKYAGLLCPTELFNRTNRQ